MDLILKNVGGLFVVTMLLRAHVVGGDGVCATAEVFYDQWNKNYTVCDGSGEDQSCSDQFSVRVRNYAPLVLFSSEAWKEWRGMRSVHLQQTHTSHLKHAAQARSFNLHVLLRSHTHAHTAGPCRPPHIPRIRHDEELPLVRALTLTDTPHSHNVQGILDLVVV